MRRVGIGRKYGNIKVEIEGVRFDSKYEAQEYMRLRLLEHVGDITGLRLQPVYELLPKMKLPDGTMQRAITYRGDFEFTENGHVVTLDSKGVSTEAFKIKAKLFRWRYPDIDFRVVKRGNR